MSFHLNQIAGIGARNAKAFHLFHIEGVGKLRGEESAHASEAQGGHKFLKSAIGLPHSHIHGPGER